MPKVVLETSPWGQHRKFSTRQAQRVLRRVRAAQLSRQHSGAHFFGHFLMALSSRRPVDGVTQKYLPWLAHRDRLAIGNGRDMWRVSNAPATVPLSDIRSWVEAPNTIAHWCRFYERVSSALFSFQSLLLVILLLICTCTYIRAVAPRLIDSNKQGFLGIFFMSARIDRPKSVFAPVGMHRNGRTDDTFVTSSPPYIALFFSILPLENTELLIRHPSSVFRDTLPFLYPTTHRVLSHRVHCIFVMRFYVPRETKNGIRSSELLSVSLDVVKNDRSSFLPRGPTSTCVEWLAGSGLSYATILWASGLMSADFLASAEFHRLPCTLLTPLSVAITPSDLIIGGGDLILLVWTPSNFTQLIAGCTVAIHNATSVAEVKTSHSTTQHDS
ncbi:hypothetical protein F5888DRAFT_1891210 [Russula emetica]|nr:hypothetical protein F5888DRAFT_1891210 [Russula emetica]